MSAVGIVSAILANMIAFYSILAMFDSILQWTGDRVGINDLTFEVSVLNGIYTFELQIHCLSADRCKNLSYYYLNLSTIHFLKIWRRANSII